MLHLFHYSWETACCLTLEREKDKRSEKDKAELN